MRKKVKKPMQIIWIARSLHRIVPTMLPPTVESGECHPVVLCMASVIEPPFSQQTYIQGAADDCEGWSSGLTPEIFWSYRESLLCASETDLQDFITALIKEDSQTNLSMERAAIVPGSMVSVGTFDQIFRSQTPGSLVITCSSGLACVKNGEADLSHLHLNCCTGKQGSRGLRREMAKIPHFLQGKQIETILICCSTGKDISVGVALAILVLYSDDEGESFIATIAVLSL